MNDTLKQAQLLLQQGQKREALLLLRTVIATEPHNAEAWWLTAQAFDDPAKIRRALQRLLQIDPFHAAADEYLTRLDRQAAKIPLPTAEQMIGNKPRQPAPPDSLEAVVGDLLGSNTPPEPAPQFPLLPPKKVKSTPKKQMGFVEGSIAILVGTLVLAAIVAVMLGRIFGGGGATGTPLLGPYYPNGATYARYNETCDNCLPVQPACNEWGLYGHVVGQNTGNIAVQGWTDAGFYRQLLTDSGGNFFMTFQSQQLGPQWQWNNVWRAPYLHIRLYDPAGQSLSGITDFSFADGAYSCQRYVLFARYTTAPEQGYDRTRRWQGPFNISYSDPGGAEDLAITNMNTAFAKDMYDCSWTGFVGTAHDNHGPVPELIFQFTEFPPTPNGTHIYQTCGCEIAGFNQSGWAIGLPAGKSYVMNVLNWEGNPTLTQVIKLPQPQGCDDRIIQIVVSQDTNR